MPIYLMYVLPSKYLSSCSYNIVIFFIKILNANFEFDHHEWNIFKKKCVSLIHSLFYFQRDASGFRRIYMDTLYEHSKSLAIFVLSV